MARHWPGPLTLVLRAAPGLPQVLTAGTGTIGVRMPGHPVALALVRTAGIPLTAPSANPSGEPPPTTAQVVRRYFGDRLDLILDGGPTAGGTGSTIADCTGWPPRVLRAGPIVL
jgi:L-threonylcarbamoyladenylate synthase